MTARTARPLPWRVMRTTGRTATETCRHRFERMAEWCARGKTRRAPTGVFHVVLPAIAERPAKPLTTVPSEGN